MPFATPYDIANRGIQHLGLPRFSTFTDQKREALEAGFVYDKLRRAELRRGVWTFATRRMILRPYAITHAKISFPTYSAVTAYTAGDVVADSTGYLWLCKTANTGTVPGIEGVSPKWVSYFGNLVASVWVVSTAYVPGDVVYVSGTLTAVYICVAAHTSTTPGNVPPNATYWHLIQSATSSLITSYSPIGYAPDPTSAVRTIFYLPANFMRVAPQDPKVASNSRQNVMAGMRYNDWEIEGSSSGYTLSSASQTTAFVFRFVADTADVPGMEDMFCDALAARIGIELCEMLTGNTEKLKEVTAAYDRSVLAARMVSAIEAGTTEEDFASPQPAQPRG